MPTIQPVHPQTAVGRLLDHFHADSRGTVRLESSSSGFAGRNPKNRANRFCRCRAYHSCLARSRVRLARVASIGVLLKVTARVKSVSLEMNCRPDLVSMDRLLARRTIVLRHRRMPRGSKAPRLDCGVDGLTAEQLIAMRKYQRSTGLIPIGARVTIIC